MGERLAKAEEEVLIERRAAEEVQNLLGIASQKAHDEGEGRKAVQTLLDLEVARRKSVETSWKLEQALQATTEANLVAVQKVQEDLGFQLANETRAREVAEAALVTEVGIRDTAVSLAIHRCKRTTEYRRALMDQYQEGVEQVQVFIKEKHQDLDLNFVSEAMGLSKKEGEGEEDVQSSSIEDT